MEFGDVQRTLWDFFVVTSEFQMTENLYGKLSFVKTYTALSKDVLPEDCLKKEI